MSTFGSIFTCGDGCGVGAKAAGFDLAWGLELRPDVAEVGNTNLGNHIRVGNILDADPHDFDYVDVLHASPPCIEASNAVKRKETALGKALAHKTVEFIQVLQPKVFTLENVQNYSNFDSWRHIIEPGLLNNGYFYDVTFVNAADMGVPQSRVRMIVRATKGLLCPLRLTQKRWANWWDTVEDLAPGFEPVTLTQREHNCFDVLLEPYRNVMFDVQNMGRDNLTIRPANKPAYTMTASCAGRHPVKCKINGEYRRMSLRACARLQSFPDWYQLPKKASLASYVIGNAVPPKMYQEIIGQCKVYL